MLKLAIKNLLDRKIRFLLTTAAVIAGVAFVVSTFVLSDSLRATFGDLATDIEGSVDLSVRSPGDFRQDFDRPPVPESLLETVAAVDGVAAASPRIGTDNVFVIDDDGDPAAPNGPPALGVNYSEIEGLRTLYPSGEGRVPVGSDEFAVNVKTADRYDLVIGNDYVVSGPTEQRSFTLVGTVNFGSPDEDRAVGATLAVFDTPTAQDFLGFGDTYSEIGMRLAPGTDEATAIADLQAAVGDDFEITTAEQRIAETEDDFGQVVDIFNNVLLAFALITLFVAAFLVNNIFQIVVGQRVRELALLRAIGATGSQVTRSIVGEAALVGAFSTITGIGLGVLLALGLRAMLRATGFDLPSGPIQLQPRTLAFAIVVGMGVTLAAAIVPALKARRVPPVAAMRDGFRLSGGGLRRRLYVGGMLTAIGAILLGLGLFGDLETAGLIASLAVGAVCIFVGVNMLSPVIAKPVAKGIGTPVRTAFGTSGRLAQENAARSPRRTASTAGALMIGLALVAMASVVGDSIRKFFIETLDNSVEADLFVRPEGGGFDPSAGFTDEVAVRLESVTELDSVARFRFGLDAITVAGDSKNVLATDLSVVGRHIDPEVITGSLDGLGAGDILVHRDPARDLGLEVGDTLDVGFPDGETETLRVAAIYRNSGILDNWSIDLAAWDRHLTERADGFVSLLIADGVDPTRARAAVDAIAADYPTVDVMNREEFKESTQQQLNAFLAVIFVFLFLSLVIALLGIGITLSLSVFERTRELGLLRAVGMTRRQMRRMVRWEAVIVAVFGGLLGIVLGVLFGVAAVSALPESIVSGVSIPVLQLVFFVVIAAIAGLVAAIAPAYRAGRLDILRAISHD